MKKSHEMGCLSVSQFQEVTHPGKFSRQELKEIRIHLSSCNICSYLHKQTENSKYLPFFTPFLLLASELRSVYEKTIASGNLKYIFIILLSPLFSWIILNNLHFKDQRNSQLPAKGNPVRVELQTADSKKQTVVSAPIAPKKQAITRSQPLIKKQKDISTPSINTLTEPESNIPAPAVQPVEKNEPVIAPQLKNNNSEALQKDSNSSDDTAGSF